MSLTQNTHKFMVVLEDLEDDLRDMASAASILGNETLYVKLNGLAFDAKRSRLGIKDAIAAATIDSFDESKSKNSQDTCARCSQFDADEINKSSMKKLQELYDYHGGPYDRGNADSYYRRGMDPHYWPKGTGNGTVVVHAQMTELEIEAYKMGYEYNEENGDRKCYR